ncbi:hypothetical protein [Engelhardtia mirabilis]|uniref:Uncharacterized protein n=1 Tax=Engelhardtia mirabilis TaxID=2528011 RepID=A0A518BKW0_9BACT|nr:hypothetical protein Pla133_26950 [Planctomycetes bacterium Pla133]QDV01933.1 hypothetical protein Pla86_26940 [Planctomycetes bacterium Pla86]
MARLLDLLRWIGPRTVAMVLSLAALELGLYHLGDYGKWIVQEQSARYGWRMLPNQRGWSRDFDVREQTNDRGFRDDRDWGSAPLEDGGSWFSQILPAAPVEEDADLLRIATVGNSMTYGTSVPVGSTWPRVLETLIAEEFVRRGDPRGVRVMNFATQGYTFEQMARIYEDEIRPWAVDLLIWPTIAADTRPMRPATDDVDYDFRRTVIRTATYDMLREQVIDHWLPPAGRGGPERTPRQVKTEFRQRLRPALELAVRGAAPLPTSGDGEERAQLLAAIDAGLARAFERTPLDRLVREVWTELTRPDLIEQARSLGLDLASEAWPALESSLTLELWEPLDSAQKRTPFAPAQQFLWDPRGARLFRIARELQAPGGQLAVLLLPNMHLTLTAEAPSPAVYWQPWSASDPVAQLGSTSLIDAVDAFREPMAELAEVLRARGFVEGDGGQDLIGDDYPFVDQSLFLLRDTGHYNVAGHRRLAEVVFARLLASGALEPAD